jgi:hypothetical protein
MTQTEQEQTSFPYLREAVKRENDERRAYDLKKAVDDLPEALRIHRKKYAGTEEQQRVKLIKKIHNDHDKMLNEGMSRINAVVGARDKLPNPLIITVEWKKSRMWGSNPSATTNYGVSSSSIGGCGYDKHSTATAEVLNQCPEILKKLYLKEEERLQQLAISTLSDEDKEKYLSRRSFIGYGSGYGVIPSFSGGVGVGCHQRICEGLGFVWSNITSTNTVDVHMVGEGVRE